MTNQRICCPGLDGSNPLTMLASLGLLAIGSRRGLVVGMGWEWQGGWRPFFMSDADGTRDAIVAAIVEELVGAEAGDARTSLEAIAREHSDLKDRRDAAVAQAGPLRKGKEFKAARQAIGVLDQSLKDLKSRLALASSKVKALADAGVAQRHPVTRHGQHLDDDAKGGLSQQAFLALVKEPAAAAYLPGLACDGTLPFLSKQVIARTHLSFANNNGGKMLLKDFAALARHVSAERVDDALFGPGTSKDAITGLGWDPGSQRSYALQFADPGKADPSCHSVHNALAFLGLEFFPVVPTGPDRRATIGFHELRGVHETVADVEPEDAGDAEGENTAGGGAVNLARAADFLTWPIWEGLLGCDEVKSLIARSELATTAPDAAVCRSIGVTVVLRSRRVAIDKRSYLTNARPVA
jgi:hypothetical protein